MAPALLDRPPGRSLINPFDIVGLRDFNLFFVLVGILGSILNRLAWSGTQGYQTAAKNAHEQKIGGVLGTWRAGFSVMMYVLLAVVAFTFLNGARFRDGDRGALACRNHLAAKAFADVASDEAFDVIREDYRRYLADGEITPALQERLDRIEAEEATAAGGEKDDAAEGDVVKPVDQEPMLTVGQNALKSVDRKKAQVFGTIFGQMRVPMALKYILPVGLVGVFCALCIFLMISTDTTYLHSWGSILVQDLILPIRGRPFTPRHQLTLLRCLVASVAVFAFFFSYLFGQVDYILMFFAITGAIWLGGAGACIVGGLYWNRSTTAGAFTALIVGSGIAMFGAVGQQLWAGTIYPMLVEQGWLEAVTRIVEGISRPMEPFVIWRVTPDRFPINSQEIYAGSMLLSVGLFVLVSLLTCRKPFNMDRMLHRGKYQVEGKKVEHRIKGVKDALRKLIGINEEYTRGDKILTWSVFIWSFVWAFLCCFVGVAVWNTISPWPDEWWATWFFINNFAIAGIIGIVSTVWFTWGGTRDLFRMFRDLKERDVNILDDGRVIGHVSADDVALVEKVDHVTIEEAHIEEQELEEALEREHDKESDKAIDDRLGT